MREILFRGKRIDNGEWVNGGCKCEKIGDYLNSVAISESLGHGVWNVHRVDPNTVGQFTGLTDKNGKKIFEGDIVKNEYEDGKYQKFKIFYNVKTLQWEVMNKYGMRGILRNVIGNMEVIGNIHDNPELLRGENDG